MSKGKPPAYGVGIHEAPAEPGTLVYTFFQRGGMSAWAGEGVPKGTPYYTVRVSQKGKSVVSDWKDSPDDPGPLKEKFDQEAKERFVERNAWIARVAKLVEQVETWAKDAGWSTCRVEKRLDDKFIGSHQLPALLMQEDTCRILLEPVGRSTPGSGGVVDLYLMPAYDDIASFYYRENRWELHYLFPDGAPAATLQESEAVPLSKRALQKVLEEMKQHAA